MVKMLPLPPPAALRLDLDSEALAANWRALDRLSGTAAAGAAVKADSYGIGARKTVPVLAAAGCRDFFVAHWGEAEPIADLVNTGMLSVLHGPRTPADAAYGRERGIRPVINTLRQARLWLEAGGGACNVMIDTGMNRLGIALADLGDEAVRRLDIDLLLSHLVAADEDVPLNEVQLRRWQEARTALPHRRASLANSAGILLGAAYHGDLTRPGIALYGGVQGPAHAEHIRQVARPHAALLQVRKIGAGESVGYNATFVAPHPMRIGTIALGYADGYLRCWSGKGSFVSHGRRLPVLGRISMDLTAIDLSAAPDLCEGDWVEAEYALPAAAAMSGLSQYELLTLLGDRFGR